MPNNALKPTTAIYEQDLSLWAEAQACALPGERKCCTAATA